MERLSKTSGREYLEDVLFRALSVSKPGRVSSDSLRVYFWILLRARSRSSPLTPKVSVLCLCLLEPPETSPEPPRDRMETGCSWLLLLLLLLLVCLRIPPV